MITQVLFTAHVLSFLILIASVLFSLYTPVQILILFAVQAVTVILYEKYKQKPVLLLILLSLYVPYGIAFLAVIALIELLEIKPEYELFTKLFLAGTAVSFLMEFTAIRYDAGNAVPPVFLLYLLSGVMILRTLRMPAIANDPKFQRMSLLSIAVLFAVSFILAMPAVSNAFGSVIKFIYLKILYPVLVLFLYAFVYVLYLIASVFMKLFSEREIGELPDMSSYLGEVQEEEMLYENTAVSPYVIWVFRIIGFAIIAYLVYRLIQKYRSGIRNDYSYEGIRESVTVIKDSPVKRNTAGDPVRRAYRKYLKALMKQGVTIKASMTSEEILAQDLNEDSAALRDLYLDARYNDHYKPVESEIKDAKRLSRKLIGRF